MSSYYSQVFDRRASVPVNVGGVRIGGSAPIVVQSMTNTDTADIDATVAQVAALHHAGSEIVRITVDRDESAAAVPKIRERLERLGLDVPLVGDFHYIGHKLLADHPACAEALAKYRINPGNVGFKDKKDKQFAQIVETAIRNDKPVRIGVNWGSLDQVLLTRLMDENHENGGLLSAQEVMREAIVQSALLSAELAEEIGLPRERIILSAKVSQVQDLIAVYTELARRSDHALHLGLTEAGMGSKGIVASSAALSIILQQGIGDTDPHFADAGARRRPDTRGAGGAGTAAGHGFPPVRARGRGLPGMRAHHVDCLSGAGAEDRGRSRRNMPEWRDKYPGVGVTQRRRDGLHRQRAGRIETCRYRHLFAGHRAKARRRRSLSTAKRSRPCAGRISPLNSKRWWMPISPNGSARPDRKTRTPPDGPSAQADLRRISVPLRSQVSIFSESFSGEIGLGM